MSLKDLLGYPDEEGQTNMALVAISQNNFANLTISDLQSGFELIATATMPEPLALLAGVCAVGGTIMVAASYVSVHRIYQLFEEEAKAAATESRRPNLVGGYSSFTAFVDDFVGPQCPFSRSSIFAKMRDITAWMETGATWETIGDLLSKTPMAGRDAIKLLIEPTQANTTVITEEGEVVEETQSTLGGEMAEYLDSLTAMGPGEARRDVRDKAGIPERFIKEAVYVRTTNRLAIHAIWGVEDKDIVVVATLEEARWLCDLLRVHMEVK